MVQDMIGLGADDGDTGKTGRQPKTRDKQIRCRRPGERDPAPHGQLQCGQAVVDFQRPC